MQFSYYFDVEKTHRLICDFQVLQFAEKAEGIIEIMFSIEINEIRNDISLKKETQIATFEFPATSNGQDPHDIDFTRVRYGDDKKWIFTVINNKDNSQKAMIGLISDTANKNPLGMDIYYDDESFDAELKANNLAILEQEYIPPVLTQTLVNAQFAEAGYPERFGSLSANYDSLYQNYKLSDFTQDFLEPIPVNSPFQMILDIAPIEVEASDDAHVFDLVIPNIGKISLLKSGLEYLIQDGYDSDSSRIFFETNIVPESFWNGGMTSKARMAIEGDGSGNLTIKYYDKTLTGIYDQNLTSNRMEFQGNLVRLDNIAVIYQK